jgi:hypothetical protein
MAGEPLRDASIQDDTNAHVVLKFNSGAHINGIDFSGATYSSAPIKLAAGVPLVADEAWHTVPSFSGSWVDFGAGVETAGYYKDSLNIVHLRGATKSGGVTRGTAMFVLPSGYRPSGTKLFAVASFNGSADIVGIVEIDAAGNVKFNSGSATLMSLDNISFRVP